MSKLVLACILAGMVITSPAHSAAVEARGTAPIVNGDVALAREQAIRNALAEAARSREVRVQATAIGGLAGAASEQTVLRSTARVHNHQVTHAFQDGDVFRVAVRAELESGGGRESGQACREGYTKRLLIAGFPLLRSEHVRPDEMAGYAQLTAGELSRLLADGSAVLADHQGALMVHFGAPEQVVGDLPIDDQAVVVIREAALKHRAQYLLVGRYRSLEIGEGESERTIDLEALVIDGLTGACVARKRFIRTATGDVVVPRSMQFGSRQHFATDFGRAHLDVLRDVADWADATVSCQPFSARVVQVDESRIIFDAGAEHGVSVGDELAAFSVAEHAVLGLRGEFLGVERRPAGTVQVTAVYPRFSVGVQTELPVEGKTLPLRAGDELHAR